jgi:hypothetical protein
LSTEQGKEVFHRFRVLYLPDFQFFDAPQDAPRFVRLGIIIAFGGAK